MTAAEVLRQARAAGVELSATPEGTLRWRCRGRLPEALRERLLTFKAEVLAHLRQAPYRDAAAADTLLAELRSEVAKVKAEFGTKLAAPLARLLDDAVVIGERYIRDYAMERARGWNPMELLRDLLPHVRSIVVNWKKMHDA